MYQGFGKFVRSKAFSIVFEIIVFMLMFYVSIRLSDLIHYQFSIDAYFIIFILLCVFFLIYGSFKSEAKTKNKKQNYLCFAAFFFVSSLIWLYVF